MRGLTPLMKLILMGVGSDVADKAEFRLTSRSTSIVTWKTPTSSFCENAEKNGSNTGIIDISFNATADLKNTDGQIDAKKTHVPIYCKDYGGFAEIEIKLSKGGNPIAQPILISLPFDYNGDRIADLWQYGQIMPWNQRYPGHSIPTNAAGLGRFAPDTDREMADSDGTGPRPAMADEGDGLTVHEEYRGYVFDGGPGTTPGGHKRLSAAHKELLVECSEEQGINSPANLGQNANPAASQYTIETLMGSVSGFYNGPNGSDVDLYWCRDEFKRGDMVNYGAPWTPQDHLAFFKDGVPLAYTVSNPPPPVVGYANIRHDFYLFQNDRLTHDSRYGAGVKSGYQTMAHVNRNDLLGQFVKLNILTRNGLVHVQPDTVHINAGFNLAFNITPASAPDPEYQGSFIYVNSIAEEGPFSSPPAALYNGTQFKGVLAWATAHELGHMIQSTHPATPTPGSLMGSGAGTVIGSVSFINPEIQQINLRARLSVKF